ncbi:MAG TPA: carboxypeptidase-like regulatory domain-containing protein [Planctomycetota bacterium]|nr:carboxypeptidase-like regulatory domain-containing protein [Planctomycetota bacterium]
MKSGLRTAAVLLLGALIPPAGLLVYWRILPEERASPARTAGFPRPVIPAGSAEGSGAIAGLVEAEEGGPLADVEVRAVGADLLRAARTDAAGAFRIERLPDEPFTLIALASRRTVASLDEVRPGASDIRFRLGRAPDALREPDRTPPPSPGELTGRLSRSDGGPLSGFVAALLRLDSSGEEVGPVAVAPCGFDGFFDIPSVPAGSYRLVVLSARRIHDARHRFAEAPVDVGPGAKATADLTFACAELRGAVRDAEGRPVAGAIVRFLLEGGKRGRRESGLVPTDEDGSFRFLELPGGRGELEVHAPGFETLRSPVELLVGASREVELRLRPAGG